jgi:endonuclease YncB( thermonuclease family)/predicted nuclease of restriction endonuclease-like (RecB) superfamily
MKALTVTAASYPNLLKHIKQEIAEALTRAHLAFEHEKIIAYWRIGESIALHLRQVHGGAGYGTQLYKNLSKDLGLGERLLYQVTQFYYAYPDFTPLQHLKWSHYRLLTTIKDGKQRTILEAKAAHDRWSKRALETFLKGDKGKGDEPKPPKPKKLSLYKGKLYTYSIFKAAYADNLLIDCGFNIYHESEVASFKGKIVETIKTPNGFDLVASNATYKDLYTYKAYVVEIVDGDTLWLNVDCGFKVWSRQKVRLRGINAPEAATPKGIQAAKFVANTLKGLPFVVIKSHGRDKYDRYLMDIFYLKGETDPKVVLANGGFLNQELLDAGLAVNDNA